MAVDLTETPLPDWVRDGTALKRIDYSDTFRLPDTGTTMTAEQWAREVLEHASEPLRRSLPRGWFVLGLRHGSTRSPHHVLGWPIRDSRDDRIVLGATSRIGMPAELVLARDGDAWLFATLVEHDNRAVAALWRAISARHRDVVRHLLRSAAGRVAH